MKVKEVSELVGISVRALHHYDKIGLLRPHEVTDAGHRLYSDQDLETLQQILFFRELGFPLKKIKEILTTPTFNRLEAFQLQHKLLMEKKRRLVAMIELIEKSMQQAKGEIEMSNKEKFDGFDFSHNPYEKEAREKWGDKAVDEANEKVSAFAPDEQERFSQIFKDLASLRHLSPRDKEAQEAIHEWFVYLNKWGSYSYEAFEGLGQMYMDDARFTENIDRFGEGLALFMRDAMAIYAKNRASQR